MSIANKADIERRKREKRDKKRKQERETEKEKETGYLRRFLSSGPKGWLKQKSNFFLLSGGPEFAIRCRDKNRQEIAKHLIFCCPGNFLAARASSRAPP